MEETTTFAETKYIFTDRLVLKVIGHKKRILQFIKQINQIYPRQSLNFSPILRNKGGAGSHCFINIIFPSNEPKKEEGQ